MAYMGTVFRRKHTVGAYVQLGNWHTVGLGF